MNDYQPIEISKNTIDRIAKEAGIVEVCEFDSYCRDSSEDARQDTIVTVTGLDAQKKKKKYYFQITTWEELIVDEQN